MDPASFRTVFISPPSIGESSAVLIEGCYVALAGYGRHCELHVNDKNDLHTRAAIRVGS